MVRDRLRVMEQRINASKLEEEKKINLQVHYPYLWQFDQFQCAL